MPAEFPGTNLINISMLPNMNCFFDWIPEPEEKEEAIEEMMRLAYMHKFKFYFLLIRKWPSLTKTRPYYKFIPKMFIRSYYWAQDLLDLNNITTCQTKPNMPMMMMSCCSTFLWYVDGPFADLDHWTLLLAPSIEAHFLANLMNLVWSSQVGSPRKAKGSQL